MCTRGGSSTRPLQLTPLTRANRVRARPKTSASPIRTTRGRERRCRKALNRSGATNAAARTPRGPRDAESRGPLWPRCTLSLLLVGPETDRRQVRPRELVVVIQLRDAVRFAAIPQVRAQAHDL